MVALAGEGKYYRDVEIFVGGKSIADVEREQAERLREEEKQGQKAKVRAEKPIRK